MRIGLNTSASIGGKPATLDQLTAQVANMAEAGFATASFAHISGLDALTTIALVGRGVPRIELATAVVPIYLHHPFVMAQQALTVQQAIGGRLVLGIGLSHKPAVEQRWGLSFEHPVGLMQEYLAILQPLLRGEAVDFKGDRLKTQAQLMVADTPAPPVVLAALGERMLRLAGEQTDGTALWLVGPKTLRERVTPTITHAAREAGRPAPRIFVGLPISVTSDVAAVRERAARGLGGYNNLPSYKAMLDREGVDGPADVLIAGSEEEVESKLVELEEAGATDFTASPLGSSDDHRRTFEFLKERAASDRHIAV